MSEIQFETAAAGDSALLLALPERVDPGLNAWCIAASGAIERELGSAIREIVIGYCTVTIYFDPLLTDPSWLEERAREIAGAVDTVDARPGDEIEIPVCYGGEFGPDLGDVARFAGCTPDEVIALHAATAYRVYLVGFIPGFAYLASVDPRIAIPRRSSPRTAVPPGSVGIAGSQTGIYPAATPGGWNIVGRTPVKPYDPDRPEPFLMKPGDQVRFTPIDANAFAAPRS